MKKFISILFLSMTLFSSFVFASSFGAKQAEFLKSSKETIDDTIEKIGQDNYDIITIPRVKLITVYRQLNIVKVELNNGNIRYFPCSLNKKETELGKFKTSDKYRWHTLFYNSYGQYAIRFNNHILFHSVLYNEKENPLSLQTDTYLNLGRDESHGCVRMRVGDIKWLYETIENDNVDVIVTDDLISESIVLSNMTFDGKDIPRTIEMLPEDCPYDPTDVEAMQALANQQEQEETVEDNSTYIWTAYRELISKKEFIGKNGITYNQYNALYFNTKSDVEKYIKDWNKDFRINGDAEFIPFKVKYEKQNY